MCFLGSLLCLGLWIAGAGVTRTAQAESDPRNIRTGRTIPDEGYCDQPYVVKTEDGAWLCTMTTGPGREGDQKQHIVATRSTDRGRTWSEPVSIEPTSGPEASWAIPLATPYGRIYVFYVYNGDNVRTLNGREIRADMLGWYCYRYSDDGGRTWSERHRLPMRVTACDRGNDWNGEVQIFWGICEPITAGGDMYFSFTKLGKYMLKQGEGWLYHSDNILHERDVEDLHFELLPEGQHGIRANRFGSVQEEHNIVSLGGDDLYCVYRTKTGYPCHAYSRDGGESWTEPVQMTYRPGGRRMKNPRACPRVWRVKEDRYLFWFHNHSGRTFRDRNPVWVAGGVEKDGKMYWSQPEILLYDPDPDVRISYPDLIREDGKYWVTETQKSIARVHRVDSDLIEGLWRQGSVREVTRQGLVLARSGERADGGTADMPDLPDLSAGGGFTIGMWFTLKSLEPGQVILDSRDEKGRGIVVTTAEDQALRLRVSDGDHAASWTTDPGLLMVGEYHHVAFIVDGGPDIISVLVDGRLCDGGESRQYGWTRFDDELGDVTGAGRLELAPDLDGRLRQVRIYDRYLRTSEAVANYNADAGSVEGADPVGIIPGGR